MAKPNSLLLSAWVLISPRPFSLALHSVLNRCALMTPIYSQNAEITASQLIEQITSLCDYCLELTEVMVKFAEHSGARVEFRHEHSGASVSFRHKFAQDPGPEVCRLCKVVTEQLPAEGDRLQAEMMDWKKAELWVNQIHISNMRHYGSDSVKPPRICGVEVSERNFVVWADKGSKRVVLYLSLC